MHPERLPADTNCVSHIVTAIRRPRNRQTTSGRKRVRVGSSSIMCGWSPYFDKMSWPSGLLHPATDR